MYYYIKYKIQHWKGVKGINMILMYLNEGISILVGSIFLGIIIYLLILGILWVVNKRRGVKIKNNIAGLMLSIYMVALLRITGIIGIKFHFGFYNMNLIPFADMSKGSILMIILNLLLFVPYGTLIPIVFKNIKWNLKKVMMIGFVTTFFIEALQLFGGRFAEIDDIIANTLGATLGFMLYSRIFIRCKKEKLLV